MITARSIEGYLTGGVPENENTLITNYWLEYVAARDGRDVPAANPLLETDLQAQLLGFTRRIDNPLDHRTNLRTATDGAFPDIPSGRGIGPFSEGSRYSADQIFLRQPVQVERPEAEALGKDRPGLLARGKTYVSNRLRNSVFQDLLSKLT